MSLRFCGRCLLAAIALSIRILNAEDVSSELRLDVSKKEVLDVVPIGASEAGRGPAEHYVSYLIVDDQIWALAAPTPFSRDLKLEGAANEMEFVSRFQAYKEQMYGAVSVRKYGTIQSVSAREDEIVKLPESSTFLVQNKPRLFMSGSGAPILVWTTYRREKGKEAILGRRFLGGHWSDPLAYTDANAVEISSYDILRAKNADFELLWTDGREAHTPFRGAPFGRVGFAKIFSRVITGSKLRSVERITRARGRYIADGVRADVADDGAAYVVWDNTDDTELSQVYLAIRRPSEKWSKPLQVSEDIRKPLDPSGKTKQLLPNPHMQIDVTALDDNCSMVLWIEQEGRLRARQFKGQVAGTVIDVAQDVQEFKATHDSRGRVHVVWLSAPTRVVDSARSDRGKWSLNYRGWSSGYWSQPQVVTNSAFEESLALEFDSKGQVHVWWQEAASDRVSLMHLVTGTR